MGILLKLRSGASLYFGCKLTIKSGGKIGSNLSPVPPNPLRYRFFLVDCLKVIERSEYKGIVCRLVRTENHHHYIRYHDDGYLYALSLALEVPAIRDKHMQRLTNN